MYAVLSGVTLFYWQFCREKLRREEEINTALETEKHRLLKTVTELETEVQDLKNYNEQLETKHQKTANEHAETVRNLKVSFL